jgi:hypothetical protein
LTTALNAHPDYGISAAEHHTQLVKIEQERIAAKANLEAIDRRLEAEYDAAHGLVKEPERQAVAPTSGIITAPIPDIRVSASAAVVGGERPVWVLSIGVQNHSPTDFFLQGVHIETSDGQQAIVIRHFLTQEWNGPRKIEPGNSYNFMIGPKDLRDFMSEHKLVCAVAVDKIGRRFRSDPDGFVPLLESIVKG